MKVLVRISGSTREQNKESIFSILQIIKRAIQGQIHEKKMDATGRLAATMDIEEVSRGGQLVAEDYIQQMIVGRRPGRFMPPDKALQYVKDKKITPRRDSRGMIPSLPSLAFMINRKLAEKGSDIFLNKRPGLDVKGAVEEVKPTLRDMLIQAGRIEISTAIYKALGKRVPPQRIRVKA